jgi:sugar-specific transcriptional regulator TrmB
MYKIHLYELGFSDKEAEVYLALNHYGASPASTLARITGIKRTSVYDAVNVLLSKKLISTYTQGSITYYQIDDVNKVLHQERDKVRLAEIAVSQLKQEQIYQHNVQVQHFQGMEGYREMYEDILRIKPKDLMVWIHLDEFYKALDPVREEQWTTERIQKKIFTRLLMQNTPLARAFQKKDGDSCRQTILLPPEHLFKSTCFIYDGFVTIFDTHENITGIRIQHPEIYNMHKQMFEMNWELFV